MSSNKVKGIMCIISSAFCFALMNMFVRMAGDLPSIQKSFFRNFIALIIAFIVLIRTDEKFKFNKKNLPELLLRSIFGTMGILCNRSEERRVGKECLRLCRSRWSPYH